MKILVQGTGFRVVRKFTWLPLQLWNGFSWLEVVTVYQEFSDRDCLGFTHNCPDWRDREFTLF